MGRSSICSVWEPGLQAREGGKDPHTEEGFGVEASRQSGERSRDGQCGSVGRGLEGGAAGFES